MSWLEDSQVFPKWQAVKLTAEGEVPAGPFLEAAEAVISLFDLITGMSMVKGDMTGNVTKLRNHLAGSDKTLQALVLAELAGADAAKVEKQASSSTCALLWLTRALLFIKELLKEMNEKPTAKLSECISTGYEATLRKHHGMVVRGTFSAALRLAPSREKLVLSMGPSNDEVMGEINKVLPLYDGILAEISKFLEGKGIKI